jgi:hypothetical protein
MRTYVKISVLLTEVELKLSKGRTEAGLKQVYMPGTDCTKLESTIHLRVIFSV